MTNSSKPKEKITSEKDPRIVRFPRPSRLQLRYENLQPGDIICTTSNSPISVLIKMKTWGFSSAFSLKKCSHIAMVVKIEEKFFLCEAVQNGFVINSCYKYLDPKFSNGYTQICAVLRHQDLQPDQPEKMNEQGLQLAFDFPQYDWRGVGAFVLPDFLKQKPKQFFCSEAVSFIYRTAADLKICPERTSGAVAPADIQRSGHIREITGSVLTIK